MIKIDTGSVINGLEDHSGLVHYSFAYHDRRMKEVAADWLAGHGIGAQPQ